MPEYIYEHPENGKQITVWQSIHEEHVYKVDDVVYNRVYTIPQASIDTKIDPYSPKDFREKVPQYLWDQLPEGAFETLFDFRNQQPITVI